MRTGSKPKRWIVRILFISYMYALFKITVLKFGPTDVAFLWGRLHRNAVHPEYIAAELQAGNLIPFKEISKAFNTLSGHSFANLFGNFAIFVPFGMFLGVMAKAGKLTLAGAFWRSLGVSLGIECAQALFSIGTFDVDDLILNSAGGSMGFVVYALGSWRGKSDTIHSSSLPEVSHETDHDFTRGR